MYEEEIREEEGEEERSDCRSQEGDEGVPVSKIWEVVGSFGPFRN